MVGMRFGRLEVIGVSHRLETRVYVWACVCDCGALSLVRGQNLRAGTTTSCGCYRNEEVSKRFAGNTSCFKHGEITRVDGKRITTPEYRTWQSLKNRCLNPNTPDYKYYGGRGIKVDCYWVASFECFLADMGRRPTPAHTLDRENGDGDYNAGNCKWATRLEPARNRKYASTKAWILAEQLGVKDMTAHHMIWQVRQKDKGRTKWFSLSPEKESTVRKFLESIICG